MRLNPDCIRAILLTVEEKCDFTTAWEYQKDNLDSQYLVPFTHEEIAYHIKQCSASSLINGVHYYDGGATILIMDLTPVGHQFLADIRKDTTWNKTKEIAQTVGSESLDVLKQIASGVIATMVQAALNGLK